MKSNGPPTEIERLKAEILAKDQLITQLKSQINKFESKLNTLKIKSELFHSELAAGGFSNSEGETEEDFLFPSEPDPLEKVTDQIEGLKKSLHSKQNLMIGLVIVLYFITGAVSLKLKDQIKQIQGRVEFLNQNLPETKGFIDLKEQFPPKNGEDKLKIAPSSPPILPLKDDPLNSKLVQVPPEQLQSFTSKEKESEIFSASEEQAPAEYPGKESKNEMTSPLRPETQPTLQGNKSAESIKMTKSEAGARVSSLGLNSANPVEEVGISRSSTLDKCRSLWTSGLKARLSGDEQKALLIISRIPALPCAKNKDMDGKSWETKVEDLTRIIRNDLAGL
ncbi:MAG TPA: hypothetical protein VNM22_03745 [Candidatus Limnocylindrales bacterium]|nr:hypothetical protein [Candidatus Limnocylindrales bacterium]